MSWLHHCNIHYKDVVKHSNVGHKFICVLGIVAMCSYSEISTCGQPRPWPRRLGLGLDLDLGVLASFNITATTQHPVYDPNHSKKLVGVLVGYTTECRSTCVYLKMKWNEGLRLKWRYLRRTVAGALQWLKWGGLGGSPLLLFEPPAIVWTPLIESIKCYFMPK